MTTWTKQKLGDLAEIVMGQSPQSKFYNESADGMPFFQGVKDFGKKYPVETKWTTYASKICGVNDILFSVRAPVGEINIAKKKSAIGRGVCAIRSKNNQNDFLYFLLHANIEKIISIGNGAVYSAINKPTLEKLEFLIPDLPTQSHIALVLSAYDGLIENNEKRIKILEEMAQRLYTEWFVKFKFPGYKKAKLVDSSLGKIPEEWETNRLDKYAKVVRGTSYSTEQIDDELGDFYLVNLKSFNRGGGFRSDGDKYFNGSVKEEQYLKRGDIVVAVTDMTTDRAVISRPARIPSIRSKKITFSADVVKIAPIEIPMAFTYYTLLDYRFTETTKNKANGANVLHLKPEAISEYKVLLPTKKLMDDFERACISIVELKDSLSEKNEKLVKMRDLLIPKLVTGRREIKQ